MTYLQDYGPFCQAVQLEFLQAVESMRPDGIMKILHTHPMHIDSMLQLAEICKMGDDSAMAAELIGEFTSFVYQENKLFSYSCLVLNQIEGKDSVLAARTSF